VVGYSYTNGGEYDAFLWDRRNGLQDLGTLGGGTSAAVGINGRGQVVGYSLTTANEEHAFLWDHRHGLQDLGIPVANPRPTAINDSGQVVGEFGSLVRAFLWDAQGGLRDLGTLHGLESSALGINEAGQVVGWSNLPGAFKTRHAFLYGGGTLDDLNDFLPPDSGWTLNEARAINGAGQVVGYGSIHGQTHAFLLTLDGGDRPGGAASSSSPGLELIQVAGMLSDARGTSPGPVSGAVVGVGQVSPALPGQGPLTEGTPTVPPAPSQGPATGLMGRQGGGTAHGPPDGFGDPVVDPLTLDVLGITT
jgi:probable HAF family extracellular repeat protein